MKYSKLIFAFLLMFAGLFGFFFKADGDYNWMLEKNYALKNSRSNLILERKWIYASDGFLIGATYQGFKSAIRTNLGEWKMFEIVTNWKFIDGSWFCEKYAFDYKNKEFYSKAIVQLDSTNKVYAMVFYGHNNQVTYGFTNGKNEHESSRNGQFEEKSFYSNGWLKTIFSGYVTNINGHTNRIFDSLITFSYGK